MPGLFFICMVLKIYNNMPLVTSRAVHCAGTGAKPGRYCGIGTAGAGDGREDR